MAVGGIIDRQKLAALNGGKRAFKRSLFLYICIYITTQEGNQARAWFFSYPSFFSAY